MDKGKPKKLLALLFALCMRSLMGSLIRHLKNIQVLTLHMYNTFLVTSAIIEYFNSGSISLGFAVIDSLLLSSHKPIEENR